jgi:hypothetical protein
VVAYDCAAAAAVAAEREGYGLREAKMSEAAAGIGSRRWCSLWTMS